MLLKCVIFVFEQKYFSLVDFRTDIIFAEASRIKVFMSDISFVVISNGQSIYQGGDEKVNLLSKKIRKISKTSGKVIYPIFKEAIPFAGNDPFWVKILNDASEGIFPRIYRYKDGTLTYKQKTKLFSKEICQDDPVLCLQNVQDSMRSSGFYSSKDNDIKVEETNQLRDEESKVILEWGKIRSKKFRRILISKYVSQLGEKYKLNDLELSKLINLTRIANSVGMINKSTVDMSNNQIVDITILCYDPYIRDFFIDTEVPLPKLSKAIIKKLNEEVEEDNNEPSIKVGGINISKSRFADWNKFTGILGKKILSHEKDREEKKSKVKRNSVVEKEEEEEELSSKRKKKKKITIAIRPKTKTESKSSSPT